MSERSPEPRDTPATRRYRKPLTSSGKRQSVAPCIARPCSTPSASPHRTDGAVPRPAAVLLSAFAWHRLRLLPAPLPAVSTAAQVGAWTLWSHGTTSGFNGQPKDNFSIDGDVFTGYLRLNCRSQPNMLLGLAVTHSRGDVDYETIDVTSVLPYAHWSPRLGLGVWGLFGAGRGDLDLRDEAGKVEDRPGTVDGRCRGSAGITDVSTDRLGAEGGRLPDRVGDGIGRPVAQDGRRRATAAAAGRRPHGVDTIGRLLADTGIRARRSVGRRQSRDGRGRRTRRRLGIPAYQARLGYRSVRPVLAGAPEVGFSPEQFEFDIGYGLVTHEGASLLATYDGVAMAGSDSRGVRIELGEWVNLRVEGERTTQGGGAEHQVALYGHLGW